MIYVASRVSRAAMWQDLRACGVPILSSWIDEAGVGETDDLSELWTRIESEIRRSDSLVFYAPTDDAPWKGAFIEIGMALALGKPVLAVVVGNLDDRSMRPVGSWLKHPLVTIFRDLDECWQALGFL